MITEARWALWSLPRLSPEVTRAHRGDTVSPAVEGARIVASWPPGLKREEGEEDWLGVRRLVLTWALLPLCGLPLSG